jgi:ABC-type dipeptide/oligopeptide/nickel transport system ATPase subunit
MPEHQAVVEARDLRVYHPTGRVFAARRWVAGPISLAVQRNEFVGLAGPSGSGKTSIGKALLNLIPTWEGDVFWNGLHVRRTTLRPLRASFGWISQEPTLAFNPRRRICQTLAETLEVNGRNDTGTIRPLCDWMNLETSLLDRYPFELSAGQIQRLSLLRVFMLKPEFVVLDEPTSSLDPINQMQILDRILEWRRRHGLSALFVAHSRRLLAKVADRVVQLGGTT